MLYLFKQIDKNSSYMPALAFCMPIPASDRASPCFQHASPSFLHASPCFQHSSNCGMPWQCSCGIPYQKLRHAMPAAAACQPLRHAMPAAVACHAMPAATACHTSSYGMPCQQLRHAMPAATACHAAAAECLQPPMPAYHDIIGTLVKRYITIIGEVFCGSPFFRKVSIAYDPWFSKGKNLSYGRKYSFLKV